MIEKKIVWLVEDDAEEADQYGRILQNAANRQFIVIHVPVRRNLGEYSDLVSNPQTGAIIFDQRLSEYSGVTYEGIEVAEFLRTIRPEIPIFILTQHETDDLLLQKEEFVECVIGKGDLTGSGNKPQVHAKRILRDIGQYEEALTAKQKRMKELIDLKLSRDLNDEEASELQKLRADIERPFVFQEMEQEQSWQAENQSREEFLQQLKDLTKQIRDLKMD